MTEYIWGCQCVETHVETRKCVRYNVQKIPITSKKAADAQTLRCFERWTHPLFAPTADHERTQRNSQ